MILEDLNDEITDGAEEDELDHSEDAAEQKQSGRIDRLRQLATEVCERLGLNLYDLTLVSGSRGRGRALRVYIDKSDGGGAGIEDCANVSRGLGLLLDAEDPISEGHYDLEVSTPGLERMLREKWHFEAVVGSQVEIRLRDDIARYNPSLTLPEGRRNFTGILSAVVENTLEVQLADNLVRIPLDCVHKGKKLVPFEIKAGAPQKDRIKKEKKTKKNKKSKRDSKN